MTTRPAAGSLGTGAPLFDGGVLRIAPDIAARVELDRGDQV